MAGEPPLLLLLLLLPLLVLGAAPMGKGEKNSRVRNFSSFPCRGSQEIDFQKK